MGNSGDKMENIIIIGAGPAGLSVLLPAGEADQFHLQLRSGVPGPGGGPVRPVPGGGPQAVSGQALWPGRGGVFRDRARPVSYVLLILIFC